ncbi:hypothetical protein [Mobilicoccus pelagius]|uniref:Uncharacterized protein n=1 Tax=Mobilicoccus pelagius NBRC 104925 TaxID=1089455 RepID=H5UW28_9MICO|nr:hypothetical protein [Mobilicoccus pelagius]GAB49936.1 hypothetical protein MOPEL_135_01740 [Mobilicoccus pelagius NBRC 104925]
MSESTGVVVPLVDGKRSTSALGRAVVADALRGVDPAGAAVAENESDWRKGYPAHFRRLVEVGLGSADVARRIAADGLDSFASRMRWQDPEAPEAALADRLSSPAGEETPLTTETVVGIGTPETELSVPYRGGRLVGDDLRRQVDRWVEHGIVEPDLADAVRRVQEHPEWLSLPGRTTLVLGAAAEMGPLRSLLRWGADVAALDLPRPDLWKGLLPDVRRYAGTLHVPMQRTDVRPVEERAGADLLHDLPRIAAWAEGLASGNGLVLGNYVYADGALNLRLSAATDALTVRLLQHRPDVALAYLATPTDVFAVPPSAVTHSRERFGGRRARMFTAGLRAATRGALYRPGYPAGLDGPGITDCIVPQQGPNYLLAKRIHRWRATDARAAGVPVAFAVAPPTRTRSVVKNRALAAAYAGAHRFGVEVFDPATSNTLMAALLVHDLYADRPATTHPWEDEAAHAAHGGLWRTAYDPRSVLHIAAATGVAARH